MRCLWIQLEGRRFRRRQHPQGARRPRARRPPRGTPLARFQEGRYFRHREPEQDVEYVWTKAKPRTVVQARFSADEDRHFTGYRHDAAELTIRDLDDQWAGSDHPDLPVHLGRLAALRPSRQSSRRHQEVRSAPRRQRLGADVAAPVHRTPDASEVTEAWLRRTRRHAARELVRNQPAESSQGSVNLGTSCVARFFAAPERPRGRQPAARQSLYGSYTSRPAIATPSGRSVCLTRIEPACAASTSGRRL